MTLGSAAQHMQTEGARARDQQEKELKHFEGKNAIGTLSHLVSTIHSVEKREFYSYLEKYFVKSMLNIKSST